MSYIYEISSDFDGDVMDKYVWGDDIFYSKVVEKNEKYPIELDYFHKDFFIKLGIQTGYHWGDIVFTNGFHILLKKTLYEKLVENGFINGYKTYKVINTVKGGPEYIGIVVTEDGGIINEKDIITFRDEPRGKMPMDFIGYKGIEKGNDIFGLENVSGTYITEKLYNFLQENADVGNVEFKKIECR